MKTQLSLFSGEFMCCGVMCDRRGAQERINRMQAVINLAYRYLNGDVMTVEEFKHMSTELDKLKLEIDKND